MVTGIPYDDIVSSLGKDFDAEGVHSHTLDDWLAERGFAVSRRYAYGLGNVKREPWPPRPWAPVHICQCQMVGGLHFVVLTGDGTIVDPMGGDHCWSDYPAVHWVAGIHRV